MENNLERSERHERESAEYANRLTRINSSKFTRSDIQTAHFIGAANEYAKVKQQARAEVIEEIRKTCKALIHTKFMHNNIPVAGGFIHLDDIVDILDELERGA